MSYPGDGEHTQSDNSLFAARDALRAGDAATAHRIALDHLPNDSLEGLEPESYLQALHLLGDTLASAGEYEDAQHIFEDALSATNDLLPDGPYRNLHQALLHTSLADIALATSAELSDAKVMKRAVYKHTSAAMDLLGNHPMEISARSARFFAFRTIMIASLIEDDTGSAAFMRLQMIAQAEGAQMPSIITEYHDRAMAMADARLGSDDDDTPTIEISALYDVPPLSSYVSLRS